MSVNVSAIAAIEQVKMLEAVARNSFAESQVDVEMQMIHAAKLVSPPDDSGRFVVQAFTRVRDRTEPPRIDISGLFELTYVVHEMPSDVQQSDFEAFAKTNGLFNAWPYFREYIHSMAVRFGLNPFILPLLHAGPSPKASTPSAAGT